VEVRVFNLAIVAEIDADLAVAFEACDWIDGDGLSHGKLQVLLSGVGVDAHATAGQETGATLSRRYV
jgi:hypothetical protein